MSSARNDLYDLAETENAAEKPQEQSLTKEDVSDAISDHFYQKEQEREEQKREQRQQKIEEQRYREQQELQEQAAVVKESLQTEMSKDKQFAEIIQKSELPGNLIEYIAEIGDADEAPLIVRELANNTEYQQQLKNSKTEVGVKRLLGKVRKSILIGGQTHVPDMVKRDIPSYNVNNSPSDYDKDYISDLALRHGI